MRNGPMSGRAMARTWAEGWPRYPDQVEQRRAWLCEMGWMGNGAHHPIQVLFS